MVLRDVPSDAGDLSYPLVVKPAAEDGSLGIDDRSVVGDDASLVGKVRELLECYGEVMVEEYVDGREVNAAVMGTVPEKVLPLSEIDFSGLPAGYPAICGYEAKWKEGDERFRGTVPLCPAPLDGRTREKIEVFSVASK